MTANRMAHSRRAVVGEQAGKTLVDWLNHTGDYRGTKHAAAHKRIEQLLDNLHFLMSGAWWNKAAAPDELDDEVFDRVQKQLSRYHMYPQIDPRRTGSLGMRTVWTSGPGDEAKVVRIITWLGDRALLWAVRRCRRCGRWFYARKQKHFFDSTKCRVAHAQSTPQFRRQRAERVRRKREEERKQDETFILIGRQQPERRGKH